MSQPPAESLERFVARTTAASGVPERVEDVAVLRRLIDLLTAKKAS